MKRRFVAVPVLVAAALSLAACSSTTTGTATTGAGAPTSTGGASSSSGSTRSSDTALAAVQPCGLLSASVLGQLQLASGTNDTASNSPTCDWERPVDANGQNGYSVGATIRASLGLGDVNTPGYSVTSDPVGSHQGKQLRSTTTQGLCIVAIGVSDTSRVDITVDAATNTDQACQVANQVAQAVAPELPTS